MSIVIKRLACTVDVCFMVKWPANPLPRHGKKSGYATGSTRPAVTMWCHNHCWFFFFVEICFCTSDDTSVLQFPVCTGPGVPPCVMTSNGYEVQYVQWCVTYFSSFTKTKIQYRILQMLIPDWNTELMIGLFPCYYFLQAFVVGIVGFCGFRQNLLV